MTDIRRSILWVILVFSLILLWDQWQIYNGREATFFPTGQPPATETAPAPKRTIVFGFWDGEEKGLLGSKHWTANPTVPLAQVKLAINCL